MSKSISNDAQPWYADGLRFKCTGCGDCCTGSPGYVWVNQKEIDAIAVELNISPEQCEEKYIRHIGVRRSLIELPQSYDCIFLDADTRKCAVYTARPRQCKTWPFWKSNVRTEETWKETCQACPGSGQGKLYQLGEIKEQMNVVTV